MRWKYQASIKGSASFSSSDGWKAMTPRFSQRREPLRISPNSATPISSATPTAYRGGPTLESRCGGTLAITTIRKSASPMLMRWPLTRAGLCPEALATTARLMPSSNSTSVSRMPSR